MKIYSVLTYIEALDEAGLFKESSLINSALAIENITYNSLDCRPLTLFACKGAAFKKDYLDDAVDAGIACYMSEVKYDTNQPVNCIIVTDIRKAMALTADLFYDKAYSKLKTIAITGTKGKSTASHYLKFILDEHLQAIGEKPSGIMTTISIYDGKITEDAHLSTPEAFELHRHLDNAVSSGLKYFVVEVSSQALKYDRVLGIDFDYGIFLNFSPDHISEGEHSDVEDYFSSKLKLFSQVKTAIVNMDSDRYPEILNAAKKCNQLFTISQTEKSADFYGYNINKSDMNIFFDLKSKTPMDSNRFALTMAGLFNVENAMAAIAVATDLGIDQNNIKNGLYKAYVRGRMEIYSSSGQSVIAFVDYAHNKLSFEKLYASVEEEYKGRTIITVFGCPGNKAYNRRKELGEISSQHSDIVYLTADDPAYESVFDICNEIKSHMTSDCKCEIIEDRIEAIGKAITAAPANSVVIVTGKGHENCQKAMGKLVEIESDSSCVKRHLKLLPVRE